MKKLYQKDGAVVWIGEDGGGGAGEVEERE